MGKLRAPGLRGERAAEASAEVPAEPGGTRAFPVPAAGGPGRPIPPGDGGSGGRGGDAAAAAAGGLNRIVSWAWRLYRGRRNPGLAPGPRRETFPAGKLGARRDAVPSSPGGAGVLGRWGFGSSRSLLRCPGAPEGVRGTGKVAGILRCRRAGGCAAPVSHLPQIREIRAL